MEINIALFAVRGSNGSIDHEATLARFAEDLIRFEEEQDQENRVIAGAVHALFDRFKGARLNTPFVVGEVLRGLNVRPENFKTLTEKVQGFIRGQSQGETLPDGSHENPTSVFVISRGKGGGIARRADMR